MVLFFSEFLDFIKDFYQYLLKSRNNPNIQCIDFEDYFSIIQLPVGIFLIPLFQVNFGFAMFFFCKFLIND